ncbi:MAG: hypothetical protein ABI686_13705, partial [Acidobacteriota bacterium]
MKFIDKITISLPNKSAEAQYFVAEDAEFLADHFPNTPMLPGLVMLEIAVQTAAACLNENLEKKRAVNFDLDSLERLYVTRRVVPNETLIVQVQISELAPDGASAYCEASAKVADETAMRAKF